VKVKLFTNRLLSSIRIDNKPIENVLTNESLVNIVNAIATSIIGCDVVMMTLEKQNELKQQKTQCRKTDRSFDKIKEFEK